MLAKEREDQILLLLQQNGAVTASHLAAHFKVSDETIRKDLLSLERRGKLSRVHGGAVAKSDMKPYLDLNERNKEFSQEKTELSKKAMKFINEGDIIGIDSGSTAAAFSHVLKENFSSLTVVTNSCTVLEILKELKNFNIILCGGSFHQKEKALCGEFTLEMMSNLHVQKSFIFPSAISFKNGICDYDKDIYQIQKKFIEISDEVFILADSSKYEKQGLLKICDMKSDYFYITDSGLSAESRNLYLENGLKIFIG